MLLNKLLAGKGSDILFACANYWHRSKMSLLWVIFTSEDTRGNVNLGEMLTQGFTSSTNRRMEQWGIQQR